MGDRIEMIKKMLAEKGEDLFLTYSLGMELASAERFDEAAEQFRRCLKLDNDYLPAYAELGKALRSAGQIHEAREVFTAGINLAARSGESHTREYLQQQLDSLPERT